MWCKYVKNSSVKVTKATADKESIKARQIAWLDGKECQESDSERKEIMQHLQPEIV